MLRLVLLTLFVTMIGSGCSTIQLQSDYSPKTDFSRLQTYDWLLSGDKPSNDVRINNDLVISAVREAVEADLQGKGFKRAQDGQPDFVITWFGAIKQKIQSESINHFYARYGYGAIYRDPYWNTQPQTVEVGEYEEGSLIFDFLDPKTNELIWRGIGSDRIKEGESDSQVKSNLKIAVTKILASFPPQ